MLAPFGVQDARLSKAGGLTAEQKRTATEVGTAGAGVYAYQAGTSLRARNTARKVSDPHQARGVAEALAGQGGHAADPLPAFNLQREAHDAAAGAHPGVRQVRDTADRWSSTFRQVKRIRRAYDAQAEVPGVGRALLRPVKAKAESDSHVMRNLNSAKTPGPTLYRGMRTPHREYKVGDHVDFHDLTSWSAEEGVAHRFAARGKSGHSHVFEREPGHATSYEAASPRFQQREWVAGGKHKVVGFSPGGAVRLARIVKSAPAGMDMYTSAFGVQDNRISKAAGGAGYAPPPRSAAVVPASCGPSET